MGNIEMFFFTIVFDVYEDYHLIPLTVDEMEGRQLLCFLARESASRRPRAAPAWAYGHAAC